MACKKSLFALALVLAPLTLHAHTGAGSTSGFAEGLNHPIHGLDHLLAMIAVGLWAAQLGGRAMWAVPASFVGVMMLGGILGMTGVAMPMVETGILVSVLLLGILVAFAVRVPTWASALLVGVFAMFHGHAHGVEMPETATGALYAAGFVLATAALHLLGMGIGMGLKSVPFAPALRVAGALVILGGVMIAIS